MNRREFIKFIVSLFAIQLVLKRLPKAWHINLGDSLARAIDMAEPGDIIFLEPGTYKELLELY